MWRCLTGTRVLQALRKIIWQDSWTSWSLVPEYRIYIEKRLEIGWENIYGTPWETETMKAIHLHHREILLVRHFCCLQINFVFRKTWSVLTVNFWIWAMFSLYNLESLKEIWRVQLENLLWTPPWKFLWVSSGQQSQICPLLLPSQALLAL